mgnify:CR=1 FL=1
MINNIDRVLIAGTGSGCGKTTVTCALLKALKMRKLNVTAFKCGPDYIDPMFHSEIIGTRSRNLDMYLCGENTMKYLLADDSEDTDFAVIEGVMGMYDGLGFEDDSYSANNIARVTSTPEILVLDVRGKSLSLAAEASGYLRYLDNNVRGIILNSCSEAMYPIYRDMLENRLGVRCYGYMPFVPEAEIGSRHLGLVTAAEIDDLKSKMWKLGEVAEKTIDIDGILKLGASASPYSYEPFDFGDTSGSKVRIGVARDKAFCFYYEDNIRLLEKYGAEIVNFSPLKDLCLPEGISGIILGGGYPEVHVARLSANLPMLAAVRTAAAGGMPVYAECGGFMYLGESIALDGNCYEMSRVLPVNSHMTGKLVRFGYKTLTAEKDNMMCGRGESIKCHEFHYSDTDDCGDGFTAENRKGSKWPTTFANDTMFAGYPHLHLWSNPEFARNFVERCRKYAEEEVRG